MEPFFAVPQVPQKAPMIFVATMGGTVRLVNRVDKSDKSDPVHSSGCVVATTGGTVRLVHRVDKSDKKRKVHVRCDLSLASTKATKKHTTRVGLAVPGPFQRVRCCHNGWYGATCQSSRQKRQKKESNRSELAFPRLAFPRLGVCLESTFAPRDKTNQLDQEPRTNTVRQY